MMCRGVNHGSQAAAAAGCCAIALLRAGNLEKAMQNNIGQILADYITAVSSGIGSHLFDKIIMTTLFAETAETLMVRGYGHILFPVCEDKSSENYQRACSLLLINYLLLSGYLFHKSVM
ncbi:hypothetical protein BN440_3182 [Erwinia amylovora MR1]|nr:hypothetical protein BN440_3182 [Erwinia amylovora MR1]